MGDPARRSTWWSAPRPAASSWARRWPTSWAAGSRPPRKPGKLPYLTVGAKYALEYGFDALEMHVDAVNKGARVLVHDDLLATGGTARAKIELVEQLGAEVVGAVFVVELSFLNGRDKLYGYDVHSLIQYDSE